MDSPKATLTKEGEISIITLNDGKANVFSPAMIKDVNGCLDNVPTDSGCLIIRGSKGMFSAGFDLKLLVPEILMRLRACPKVVLKCY